MSEPSLQSPVLQVTDLEVRYAFQRAVNGLSFSVAPGECLGLLGVNGAGKTSTIGAVLGMLKPKSGEVKIFGGETGTAAVFRRIGFAPEDGVPPEYLSSEEYLSFVAGLKIADPLKRAEAVAELLRVFELSPRKRVREFSKGMKRRITLAQAFLGEPDLLILDEPLNGLDPLIIIKLREMIERHLKRGAAIIYSSHILTEVEKTCNRVLLLKGGERIYHDSVEAAVKEFGSVESAFAVRMGSGG